MRNGADTTFCRNRGMASSAVASFSCNRARGGACSSSVRLQKSDRSAGSFSTAHMTASESLMRSLMARGPRVELAGDTRVLVLVQPCPRQQFERAVDVVGAVALHEADEHRAR